MKTTRPALTSTLAALALACLSLASTTHATTINWGTYISPSSYLFDSTGTPLTDDFVFELGTFGTTFTPTASNMSDWLTNWKPFDRATAPSTNGWNSSTGTLAHSATAIDQPLTLDPTDSITDNTLLSQSNTFTQNELAYIWIYKDTAGNPNPSPAFSSGLEWALVTNTTTDGNVSDAWLFPAPSGHVSTTLDWRIEDATVTPFGGLNNTQGPGSFSNTPADFILQTHTTAAIPEPSSTLLIASLGLLRLLRKRTRY